MKRRRVKITGIGPVTPAGIGREAFWEGILEPVSRVRPYRKLEDELGPFVAAYIDRFDIGRFVDRKKLPHGGAARHTLFALAGAVLALADAGLSVEEASEKAAAVFTGTSVMDFEGITRGTQSVFNRGVRGVQPRLIFSTHVASIATTVVSALGLQAKTMAVQSSCCGGLDAIGFAAEAIASGEIDLAICGGTESPLFKHPLLELRGAGLTPPTSERASEIGRPFDLWRTTGVVAEGACMVVLEPEESPRKGMSWVRGYAYAQDENGDLCGGLGVAIRHALANAQLRPRDVEVINAWGPGHRIIDAAEVRALAGIFQEGLEEVPAVSIKGAVGNALAAAPAIQVASAVLAQAEGVIPPTVNWRHPDPECALNLSGLPRVVAHDVTLIDSHGLSGMNSSMVLERCT